MAGVTDSTGYCARKGGGLVYTEMVSKRNAL